MNQELITKQDKIDFIYKHIKPLMYDWIWWQDFEEKVLIWDILDYHYVEMQIECAKYDWEWASDCWHDNYEKVVQHFVRIYDKKRLPIDDQSETCIDFVVDLIKQNIYKK